MRLTADSVYLSEDVSQETLAQIDAATIYMPHPPEVAENEEASDEVRQILPFPTEPQPAASRICYLMLQQLN